LVEQRTRKDAIGDLVLLSRNMVAAILVQLERHSRYPEVKKGAALLRWPCFNGMIQDCESPNFDIFPHLADVYSDQSSSGAVSSPDPTFPPLRVRQTESRRKPRGSEAGVDWWC
jgi:hypothetical protein